QPGLRAALLRPPADRLHHVLCRGTHGHVGPEENRPVFAAAGQNPRRNPLALTGGGGVPGVAPRNRPSRGVPLSWFPFSAGGGPFLGGKAGRKTRRPPSHCQARELSLSVFSRRA